MHSIKLIKLRKGITKHFIDFNKDGIYKFLELNSKFQEYIIIHNHKIVLYSFSIDGNYISHTYIKQSDIDDDVAFEETTDQIVISYANS